MSLSFLVVHHPPALQHSLGGRHCLSHPRVLEEGGREGGEEGGEEEGVREGGGSKGGGREGGREEERGGGGERLEGERVL